MSKAPRSVAHQSVPYSRSVRQIQSLDDLVVIMFQDPDKTPPKGWLNYIIHYAVLYAQPSPPFCHVELFHPSVLASIDGTRSPHFATYIGERAAWWMPDGFYKNHMGIFRAVPFVATGIGPASERVCQHCVGTPYSISRYLTRGPLRFLARLLPEKLRSPAHCGILTSRIIKAAGGADGNAAFPDTPSTYSPSRLYLDATDFAQSRGIGSGGNFDQECANHAITTLQSGTDIQVAELTPKESEMAIRGMAAAIYTAPPHAKRDAEVDLASALIRLSYVRHSFGTYSPQEAASDVSSDEQHLLRNVHTPHR